MTFDIKICGLRTATTVEAAADAGATMIGLVFFPKSPRHVSRAEARTAAGARAGLIRVALTVNADDQEIADILGAVPVDWLQLHGAEPPERVRQVKDKFGLPVMKALGVATPEDVAAAQDFAGGADRILFDAKPPQDATRPGGLGAVFDWGVLAAVDGRVPWMLSGGLTPDNVAEAVTAVKDLPGFSGVDVSSGVERAPGEKDAERIAAFVTAAKAG
ncbi:MAG: phosphoribosylanthranilate isomerase [Pseudomonadota bacterium]